MVLARGQTNRSMECGQNPEVDPCKYHQLIFDKGAKSIQWKKKKIVFSINSAGFKHCTWFTNVNSKWIINPKIKHKTMKLLKDKQEKNLSDLGFGDEFSDKTSKAQSMK